jgi:hypothetical protein
MKFGLVVGGQRGHQLRYAHSKAADLNYLNLGLNFIVICILKALFVYILFSLDSFVYV